MAFLMIRKGANAGHRLALDKDTIILGYRAQSNFIHIGPVEIGAEAVRGHDPREDLEWFEPYCPLRNITANYPPTILIHGTSDTDVPHQESTNLAIRFDELGLKHARLSDETWLEKLSVEPLLLRVPLVRNGSQLTVGRQCRRFRFDRFCRS